MWTALTPEHYTDLLVKIVYDSTFTFPIYSVFSRYTLVNIDTHTRTHAHTHTHTHTLTYRLAAESSSHRLAEFPK